MSQGVIELRGVAVNNLRHIDLDLPRGKLIAICGVSGSGKTSLALDTLYAEGQRRYIETFSPYTRQFLEQLDKPEAERIDGMPPAIAVTHKNPTRSPRATVGSASEVNDYLGLLFARIGEIECNECNRKVRRDCVQSVTEELSRLPAGRRVMIGFESKRAESESAEEWLSRLIEAGYVRALVAGRTLAIEPRLAQVVTKQNEMIVVLDRLTSGGANERLAESVESAMAAGGGEATALIELQNLLGNAARAESRPSDFVVEVDDRMWEKRSFSANLRCNSCGAKYVDPEPQLFNFNRPLGACAVCEGFGRVTQANEGGYLAAVSTKSTLRTKSMSAEVVQEVMTCPACQGRRLRPEALAVQIGGKNIAQYLALKVVDAQSELVRLNLTDWQQEIARPLIADIRSRLQYLSAVGVGYLTLDRSLASLSGGEVQRIALTTALGSSLVDVLYVLDEPSIGLHPRDVGALAAAIEDLRTRGNTVIVVEHEPELIRRAEQVVEIGPGAGEDGGDVVFQGTPAEMLSHESSLTGDWLSGRRHMTTARQRERDHGKLTLRGARGNNLQQITVEFPLGVLCCVTGVSGAGKSTLVKRTLYPALAKRLKIDRADSLPRPLPFDDLTGVGQLENVMLVDQSPIGRSPRSNPVTYLKAFDPIRTLFAEQLEAKTRGFTASHFSFNVEGGRCEACEGAGIVAIDMQFMPDVTMRCRECNGRRYRREVLDVKYRGRDISEVLEMTAREAFTWFRGERAVQAKLKPLLDVGLDYLRLGQSAKTLSGGEAQRLKLASHLAANRSGRTLFLLEEPTSGLHFSDIVKLLDCFDALIDVGHSLIAVEHNLQIMKASDHIIDLGPGAADEGGQIVSCGTPEELSTCADSITGHYLAREFARDVAYDAARDTTEDASP